jgi:N-methylhydantoinase A
VVNGIIDPDYFLGGEIKLDKAAAEHTILEKLAKPLRMNEREVSSGIFEIACENMAAAMKLVSVERGYDPRDFSIVAFGGAGPMVATFLARELGSKRVIIPVYPGVFSAVGMLAADVRFDLVQAYPVAIADIDLNRMNEIVRTLEERGIESLKNEKLEENIKIIRTADMRYVGQNFEIHTPMPSGELNESTLKQLVDNFHAEHEKWYGHKMIGQPVELVNVRVNALCVKEKPRFSEIEKGTDTVKALKGKRKILFHEKKDFIECPVFDREKLRCGMAVDGPAIIEEMASVTVLLERDKAQIDEYGDIIVEVL